MIVVLTVGNQNGRLRCSGQRREYMRSSFAEINIHYFSLSVLCRKLWEEELSEKWPRSYWDDWMREPEQRRGRACIRPEISRTKTFGKIGVSNGMFYEKHLKHIRLNDRAVDFARRDLMYLEKSRYDQQMGDKLARIPVVSLDEVKTGDAAAKSVFIQQT